MSIDHQNKRILIVEDNRENGKVLKAILGKKGFANVDLVHTGQQAIDFLGLDEKDDVSDLNEYKTVSLIILDVVLPDLVGFDLCKRIKKEISQSLPVILITGFDISEYVAQGVEAGADDFLSKPIDPDELIARANIMLQRSSLSKEATTKDEFSGQNEDNQHLACTSDTHINQYVIKNMLSWSSSSIVYTVTDEQTGKQFALKRLLKQVLEFPDIVDRFNREIEILKSFEHPNICHIYENGEIDGCAYCVMEFIHGQTLESALNNRQMIDFQTILDVATGVARGLECVHNTSIIHRDVKLNNIFLCDDGTVKLGDFGVAMQIGETRITQHGYAVGTPIYMSPEQFDGAGVSFVSDVYSYGATLYHFIAGAPPFTADNVSELMYKHLHDIPKSLSTFRSDIPEGWDEFILNGCLAKLPEDRIQSMSKVIDAIPPLASPEKA